MHDWRYKGNTTNPNKPIWNEYIDEDTGQSTLDLHTPKKVSKIDTCEHEFEYIDNGNSIRCKKCEYGQRIVLGIHKLVNGKLITNLPDFIKSSSNSV